MLLFYNSILDDFTEIINHLKRYAGFQNLSACWEEIRELLCGVYFPRCDDSKVAFRLCYNLSLLCKAVELSVDMQIAC